MDVELSTVMKWAATILVTGFIAQFGKMLAKYLVEKIKSRKARDADVRGERTPVAAEGADGDSFREKQERKKNREAVKGEKKNLKAERKIMKKKQ